MSPSSYQSQRRPFEKSNYPLWIFFAPVMTVISGPAAGCLCAVLY